MAAGQDGTETSVYREAQCAGKQGAGEGAEISSKFADSRKRLSHWAWLEHLRPESLPSSHFVYKVTPTPTRLHLLIVMLPRNL